MVNKHTSTMNALRTYVYFAAWLLLAAMTTPLAHAVTNQVGPLDGTFETGLGTLPTSGDVSLIDRLGVLEPTEGTQALLLTTGPDSGTDAGDATVSSVTIADFSIGAEYATLRLDYSFLTNEPEPSFANDSFDVELILQTSAGEELLLASDTFDSFSDAPWTGYDKQTGFRTMVADVTGVAGTGEVLTLILRISDGGDGRRDSAVLIDDVRLAEPGIPVAVLQDSFIRLAPGEAFLFDGSASSDDVGIASYDWNFNNGFIGFGPLISFDRYDEPGIYQGTFTVTDDDGNTDTAEFTVVVGDINTAPTIVSAPNVSASEGVPYTYQIVADDPQVVFGDTLTYALLSGPVDMTIDTATGLVSWTPPLGGANQYDVEVSVTDSLGESASQAYTIAIGPEVYVAALGDSGRLWFARSTGAGWDSFTEIMDIHGSSRSRGLAIADFDGDKDFDIISGQRTSSSPRVELYLHQREAGRFKAPVFMGRYDTADPSYTMDFAAGDFDEDGDQDLVINTNTARTLYLSNNSPFTQTEQVFFSTNFETGTAEGWGGAFDNSGLAVDSSTSFEGVNSMRLEATGVDSDLSIDINPSSWFYKNGSKVSFAYRIPAGVPAGIRVNVTGYGWIFVATSAAGTTSTNTVAPGAVTLIDDDTWRTVELDLYAITREVDPVADTLSELEWKTFDNAQPGDVIYFDDFKITRPQIVNAFTETQVPGTGGNGRGMDSADLNGDGFLDFARARSDAAVFLYYGDGNGNFTATGSVIDFGNDTYGLVADDFDNDGIVDLIGNNNGSGDTGFARGNGDGTYQPALLVPNLDFNNYASFGARDFDGDGNVDVVASTYTNRQIHFIRGNGDGTFQAPVLLGATSTSNVVAVAAPEGAAVGRPFAFIDVDTDITPEGGTINFDASSSYDDGDIVSYVWDFGNGEQAAGVTASSTFSAEGPYTVVLTVTDNEGNVDRAQILVRAQGAPPVADAGGPYVFGEERAIDGRWRVGLDGTASTDAETSIQSYAWDFDASNGIGVDSTEPFPRVTYYGPGTYTVTLTVTDGGGQSTTVTTTVTVAPQDAPVAGLTGAASLDENDASLGVFTGWYGLQGSTDDSAVASYSVDWGDGSSPFNLSPMTDNFDDGDFNGWTIGNGAWSVNNQELLSSSTAATWYWMQDRNRVYGDFQLEADFKAESTGGDGYVGFVFRNANTARSTNSFLIYSRDSWETWSIYDWSTGTTLVNNGPGWDEDKWYHVRIVMVGDDIELYVTPEGGSEALIATFSSAAHPRGGIGLLTHTQRVRFDNVKVTPLDDTWTQSSFALPDVAHSFADPGTYDVTLTVTDHAGQTNAVTQAVDVTNNASPVAAAGGPYTLDEGQALDGFWTLPLDLTASSDDVGVERFIVDFGDGTSYSTGQPSGAAATYFSVGTDLYGYDPGDGTLGRVIGLEDGTDIEIVNLADGSVLQALTLNRLQTLNGFNPGTNVAFKVRATKPVVGYYTDFAAHNAFLPSMDGTPVGREFIGYFDVNSGLYVYAYEDASVRLYNTSGTLVLNRNVRAGTYTTLPITGATYRAVSSGRIAIQTTGNTGYTTVPSSSGAGVGRLFYFATQNSGSGGSLGVFAYDAANVEVFDMDTGVSLYTTSLAPGDFWFQNPVGNRRLRLVSDGDVEVWAGDNEGGATAQFLGDDLSFAGGREGTEFLLHELASGVVMFGVNNGTAVEINGNVVDTLNMDDYRVYAPADLVGGNNGVHRIVTSQPVVIQTLGTANVLNDLGTYIGGATTRHRYAATGNYTVTVTAVDRAGQTNTATTTVDVLANDVPVPLIDAPAEADETFATGGQWSVDFDASGSSDDFGISTYEWDFGDGNTATGAQVTHAFGATGTYEVTLTVTDHAGQSVTTTQSVVVSLGAPPVADSGGPYVLGEESAEYGRWVVGFDGSGSTDDAGIFDYLWNFGPVVLDDFESDGPVNGLVWTSSGLSASGGTLPVTGTGSWTNRGYFADERISRAEGVEVITTVTDSPGTGNMMWGLYSSSPSGYNYTQMTHAIYMNNGRFNVYENSSNRFTGPLYTRGLTWDLRIVLGETGARYYYREAGTTAWNELGPVNSLASTQTNLRVGATVLNGTFAYDNPTVNPLLLDGVRVERTYFAPVTNQPLSLTVRDNALQSNTESTTLTLESGDPPVAEAGGPLTAEVGSFINFNGSGSADDNAVARYVWDFGETSGGPEGAGGSASANLPYTGKGPTPRHFYKSVGTFNVTLEVFDNLEQSASDTTTVEVIVGDAPTAAASVARAGAAGGPPVYFDADASTDDYGIVQYRWDFDIAVDSDGDGDPANDLDGVGKTPFHTYPSATGGDTDAIIYSETFDTPLDSSEWSQAGAAVVAGQVELVGAGGWGARYLMSLSDFPRPGTSFRGQVILPAAETHNMMWGVKDTGGTTSYTALQHGIYFNNGVLRIYERASNRGAVNNFTYQPGVLYDVRVDTETARARYYMRVAGSGDDWTELTGYTPLANNTVTPLRIHAVATSGTWRFDNFEVVLPADRTAALTVVDGAGQTSTTEFRVPVTEELPPHVVTVPWVAFDPLVPHETYNGKPIRLKGIVRDADPVSYEWDFGDGTQSGVLTVTNPFDLSVEHTYPNAPDGTPFVATLTVTDAAGNQGSATYPVIVKPQNLTTEINVAIDEGLWYLHQTQTRSTAEGFATGYWTSNARASATASAIQAFEINGHLESVDHQVDPYAETVQRGLRQLFRDLGTISIGTQTYGEPDSNGNGIGIQTGVNSSGGQPIYQGGQVMDAIASSGSPLTIAVTGGPGIKGRSYFDILTDMADAFAWGQTEQGSGGAWRYAWNSSIDNSAAQWGAIGLLAAQDIFGIPYPLWVEERNIVWLNRSYAALQTGFGYTTGGTSRAGTPSGMVQLIMDELDTSDYRWKTSERWIANNWTNQYIINPGNRPYYPYYALTKAMRLALPEAVETFAANGFDWFRDPELGLARTLIDDQLPNGQFPGSEWITAQLRSAWGVIILSRTLFVQPPVADAGRDRVWGVDIPLEFDASNSFHLDPFREIVSYEWDFDGDGNFDFQSDQPFATYTYSLEDYPEDTLPVAIDVRLRVTDNNIPPLTDNDTVEIIIAVPPHPPVAEAGGDYSCTAGLPCELDGSGSFDIDPTDFIARYEWDLDGFPFDYTDATGVNPTPVFEEGVHNIGLRVYDNGVLNDLDGDGEVDENERLTDQDFATVTAEANLPPTANANGPYEVDEGSVTLLSAAGSSDPNGDPLVYEWDLDNDGVYDDALGANPNYLGVDDGVYTVGLRVTDTLLADTTTALVTVNNVAPIVEAGIDLGAIEGETLTFDGSFTDPGVEDTHTIEWDFGDGSATQTGTLTPTHTYENDGVYTATLTVTDDDGGVGVDTLTVTVGNAPPVVEAGADQIDVPIDSSISLDPAAFTDAGILDVHTATIDWGDGTAADVGAVTQGAGSGSVAGTHTYTTDGTFVVRVTVTDDAGGSGFDTFTVTVIQDANTDPVVDAGPDAIIDEGATFVSAGSFIDPDADIWTATVDYGDGSGSQPLPLAGQGFSLSHTYADNGVYTVTVTVNDGNGGIGVDTAVVTVNNVAPAVDAGPDASLTEGDTFVSAGVFTDPGADTFAATVDYGEGAGPVTLALNPDGSFALSNLYQEDGTYTVTVTVTDDDGGVGVDTATVTVGNAPPVVDAGPDQFGIATGGVVNLAPATFVDAGVEDTHTAIIDWGDGTSDPGTVSQGAGSGSVSGSHGYAGGGTYTVTVTVTDDEGASGSDSFTVTVNTAPVVDAGPDAIIDEGATFASAGAFADPDPDVWAATVDYGEGAGPVPLALNPDGTFALSNVYEDNGIYTVTVTINDGSGGIGVDTAVVTVNNVAPAVDAGPDAALTEGDTFTSVGGFTDPGADTYTATVDYGEGAGSVPLALNPDGSFALSNLYQEDGTYTVTVTVTDDDGGVGVDTATVTVGNAPPVVDAGADQLGVATGGVVSLAPATFTDAGVEDTHTATIDWGDGTSEAGNVVQGAGSGSVSGSHGYAGGGTYLVTVTVTDDEGASGSDSFTVTVNTPPVVDAGPDQNIDEGGTFVGTGFFADPDANVWTATVDYGDGSGPQPLSLAGQNFSLSHTYVDNGVYTVTVTVDDGNGGIGADTMTVTVNNVAPAVDAGPDAALTEGDTFVSAGVFTDPGADTFTGTVDYGDGAGSVPLALNPDGSFALSNLYQEDGTYTVAVTVTDDDGGVGVDTATVTVANAPPVVDAGADQLGVATGGVVSLAPATFTDAGVEDTHTATIDWGDGTSEAGNVVQGAGSGSVSGSHGYAGGGTYLVTVTVTDDEGASGSDTFTVTVNTPPVVDVGPDQTIDEGGTFSGTGFFADPDANVWTATVDYGDGSGPQPLSLAGQNFSLSHTYVDNGVYTVTVTVDDGNGGIGADTMTVVVNNVAPAVDAGPDAALIEGDTFVSAGVFTDPGADTFTATVDYGEGAGPVTLAFSGGSFALNNLYEQNGVYTVTVTVVDDDGGVGVDTATVTVANAPPVVDAGADQSRVPRGAAVSLDPATFTDAGVLDIHTATIDWGDGSPVEAGVVAETGGSGTVSGSHDYATGGIYTITVTVRDADGGVGSDTLVVTVNTPPAVDAGPDAIITEGDGFVQAGSFTDPDPDMWSATVDYGDGSGVQALTLSGMNFELNHLYADDGTYIITVQVSDDVGGVGTDTVTVVVENAPPQVDVNAPSVTVGEGDIALNSGTFQDVGTDSVVLSVSSGELIQTGTLSGTWSWSLQTLDGPDDSRTVTVTAVDSDGASSTVSFELIVLNLPPLPGDDAFSAVEDTPLSAPAGSLLANDVDPGLDLLTSVLATPPANGSVVVNADGSFVYTPDLNFNGVDTFVYNAVDDEGAATSATVTINVQPVNDPPTLTVATSPIADVQYSDPLSVTIDGDDVDSTALSIVSTEWSGDGGVTWTSGLPSGLSLSAASCAAGAPPVDCSWSVSGNVQEGPGTYQVRLVANDNGETGDPTVLSDDTGFTFTVLQEDARATYIGPTSILTPGPDIDEFAITLTARVLDISAVSGDPATDPYAGDISNATVEFRDEHGALLCAAPEVVVSDPGDPTAGVATCVYTNSLGNNEESRTIDVTTVVGGHYIDNADNEVVIIVARPEEGFITGGGYLIEEDSAGVYAAGMETRINYGFKGSVTVRRNNTQYKGRMTIIIRAANGRKYKVKSNALLSLGVQRDPDGDGVEEPPMYAEMDLKANLHDLTDPDNPISLGGNLVLQLRMTENGEPGIDNDTVSFTLWDGATLLFSSNWNGAQSVEQAIAGGNLQIH